MRDSAASSASQRDGSKGVNAFHRFTWFQADHVCWAPSDEHPTQIAMTTRKRLDGDQSGDIRNEFAALPRTSALAECYGLNR